MLRWSRSRSRLTKRPMAGRHPSELCRGTACRSWPLFRASRGAGAGSAISSEGSAPVRQLTGHASLRVVLCRQSEVGDVVTTTIARVFGNNFKVRQSCSVRLACMQSLV